MNQFGYGALMNDYVYLEEVGRQVGDWGREIVNGGYTNEPRRARGRGGMRGAATDRGTRTKKDVLKMQLDTRDIDMSLLPPGMERKKLNQSCWDFKCVIHFASFLRSFILEHRHKTAFLTIQFVFHPPVDPLRPPHIPQDKPITVTTHRNDIDHRLLSILQKQVSDKPKNKRDARFPAWLTGLVVPEDEEAVVPPACYMLAPTDPSRKTPAYHKLDTSRKLGTALRFKEFVEFPVIEVWEEGGFSGDVVAEDGSVEHRPDDGERSRKRRKLDVRQGKVAIKGLLGDYGSEEDESVQVGPNGLEKLDGYEDSDNDQEHAEEWEDDGEPFQDPAALLEQIKSTGALPAEDDDEVDWGDSN